MPTTDAARWSQLQVLFAELADASVDVRRAKIAEVARQDPALAAELQGLLAADSDSAGSAVLTSKLSGAVATLAAGLQGEEGRPAWIGDYRITGTLGSGGMGIVYLAEQESPRRTVALKVIRSYGGASAVRRFQREAELHGRLQHPGIALIYEAGLAAERDAAGGERGPTRPFFAMEYVKGDAITAHVRHHGLGIDARVELMAKVCDAIEHAHSRGVIHRDLKSANVLVDEHGNPKVLDFGIARAVERDQATTLHTAVGEVIGTLPYMSPEQVSGDPQAVGVHSDIYALGVMLFETLTGRRPIDLTGRTIPEAVRMVTDDEPTRLGTVDRNLRGDLETIVGRCLEKDPARRYPTAGALADDLRRHLAHRPIDARPASTIYQLSKFARRNRPLVAGVATAFVALLAATIVSAYMAVEAWQAGQALQVQLNAARVENARSTQSFEFLRGLLTAADPANSGGKQMTVRELVGRAADELNKESESSAEVRGMLARLIGYTLGRLGDLERAEATLRRSVELHRRPDENSVSQGKFLAEALANLGDVLRERDKHDEAALALAEAIELRRTGLREEFAKAGKPLEPGEEPTDPSLAIALNNLSLVHQSRGDFASAERLAREAWKMECDLVAAGWNRRANMATAQVNMAAAQLLQGRAIEAEPALREAVATHEVASGPEAPITQTVRNNLAVALRSNGKYAESEQLIRKVNEIRRRTLPPGHFEIAKGESNLAQTLAAMGDYVRALPIMDDALAATAASYGQASADAARLRALRAGLLDAIGRGAEALAETRAALEALEAAHGPQHIRVAEALVVRAAALRHAGQCTAARDDAARALQIAVHTQTASHPVAFHARREQALAALASGDDAAGTRALGELAADLRNAWGSAHPSLGLTLLHLAEAHRHAGRSAEAIAAASEAAAILEAPGGVAPWHAAYARLLADPHAGATPPQGAGTEADTQRHATIARLERDVVALAGPQAPDVQRLAALRGAQAGVEP